MPARAALLALGLVLTLCPVSASGQAGQAAALAAADTAALQRLLAAEDARGTGPDRIEPLLAALKGPDTLLRRVAVRGLGRFQRPELGRLLLSSLNDPLPSVRAEAANAVAQSLRRVKRGAAASDSAELGVPEAAALLSRALGAEADPARRGRARAIARPPAAARQRRRACRRRASSARGSTATADAGRRPWPVHAGPGAEGDRQPRAPHGRAAPPSGRRGARHHRAPARAAHPRRGRRSRQRHRRTRRPRPRRREPPHDAARHRRALGRASSHARPARALPTRARSSVPKPSLRPGSATGLPTARRFWRRHATAIRTSRSPPSIRSAADAPTREPRLQPCARSSPAGSPRGPPTTAGRRARTRCSRSRGWTPRRRPDCCPAMAASPRWEVRQYAARAAAVIGARAALFRLAADPDHNVQEAAIVGLALTARHEADSVYIRALGSTGHQVALAGGRGARGLHGCRRPRPRCSTPSTG